ncbi:MAG: isoprenylcysteine carboxylmethyltransferase family protein [Saprospiraceae bacterium]|jgi:protein-S-isoprenylcysteine O-methyltransferase Ste14|nr:isoprenylcysteine carboxylmethyltransferase family protein [Saprospiraceae bacterium]MBP6447915.1 isoprenylcysteine carboxylmethyltransferase family protein [Saprospiraceae bacterium]
MLHKNLKDNTYVIAQFTLFALFILNPELTEMKLFTILKLPGLILFISGIAVCFVSILQLNHNLTAFPTPKETARLYTGGLYKYIRHPIYTGVIMIFLGMSLYWSSVYQLMITTALIVLFYYKSAYEEAQLCIKFSEYKGYQSQTGRFFPWM